MAKPKNVYAVVTIDKPGGRAIKLPNNVPSFTLYTAMRTARAMQSQAARAGIVTSLFRVNSWKPVFAMPRDPVWYDNAQRFATEAEARESAYARFMVWTLPDDYTTLPSSEPVNYRRVDGRDESIR